MKKWFLSVLLACLAGGLFSQGRYQYSLDLGKLKDDKLQVSLIPPASNEEYVEFHFPKIVPGTYAIYDFGRFIEAFEAKDKDGNSLEVERKDKNRWMIPNNNGISNISYWVKDTYDYEGDTLPFEPAGSSFEKGKVFMLNTFCLMGYIKGQKRTAFDITIIHPEELYGATPLKRLSSQPTLDRFFSGDYYELVDSPILYSKPDTTFIPLDKTQVEISVYSPGKKVTARDIRPEVKAILEAQRDYLGGYMPVDRYSILVLLQNQRPPSGGEGALEHSYSTLFTLYEREPSSISTMITRVTAHEFFHIITPLAIHSEQIHYFDFQDPQMSQNLWLYEGITEYAANHVQLKQGLISFEDFLKNMRYKIKRSKEVFNDTLPFTTMSKGCLDEYKDEYLNVYEKGALIGLCLDIHLRDRSQGRYGTQELMRDLGNRFGVSKPFPDEQIFDIIGNMTSSETKEFLERYVAGKDPLPLEQTFNLIGVEYRESKETEEITLGSIGIGFDPEAGNWIVGSVDNMNSFGREMGFQKDDILVSLNGEKIEGQNFPAVVKGFKASTKEGDQVEIVVKRMKGKKLKEKTLTGTAQLVNSNKKYVLEPLENPSAEQLGLRNAWGKI